MILYTIAFVTELCVHISDEEARGRLIKIIIAITIKKIIILLRSLGDYTKSLYSSNQVETQLG